MIREGCVVGMVPLLIANELRVSLRTTGLRLGQRMDHCIRMQVHCFPTLGSWLYQNNLQEVQLSESIVICMQVLNCTSNLGFIQFTIFFITFLSLQKGLKMAFLSLKIVIFDLKMGKELSEDISV